MRTDYEKHLDKFIKVTRKILPRNNYTIVEIGARDCVETVAFDVLLPGSRIYTFECNPDTLPLCRKAVSGKNNITLIEKAVTDTAGFITFFQINNEKTVTGHPHGTNPGASSIFKANEEYPLERYSQNEIQVPAMTLKNFFEDYNVTHVDLLWMDIQGAELLALKGAGRYLSKISIIHLETEFFHIYKNQPLFPEIKAFLNSHGFRLYTFTTIGKFAGDAVFINKRLSKFFFLPEMIIYFYFRLKEKFFGKIRGALYKLRNF